MDDQSAVRCMRHCSSDHNIFYVNFPKCCPICGGKLEGTFFVPPFRVPHPFVSSSQAPYSVVIRPTDGSFISTYHSGQDLHIGITTSKGFVFNYDEEGVHIDSNTDWSLCVALSISDILNTGKPVWNSTGHEWDGRLKLHSQRPDWSCDKYDPFSHNCYDFVLSFLRTQAPERQDLLDKTTFSRDYVLPLTIRAAKYIDIQRKIIEQGTLVMKADQ